MPKTRWPCLGLAVLVSSLLLSLGAFQAQALQPGENAPAFELPGTTAELFKLADYVGKKPVVLFFYIGAFTKG